jgi:hypothetical protein
MALRGFGNRVIHGGGRTGNRPSKLRNKSQPPPVSQTGLEQKPRRKMPILLLWVGIPVLLLGGGYAVVHFIH